MEYISTRSAKKTYSFKDVFLKGLADDGGLFVPKEIPLFSQKDLVDAIEKAERRIKREKKEKEKAKQSKEISNIE